VVVVAGRVVAVVVATAVVETTSLVIVVGPIPGVVVGAGSGSTPGPQMLKAASPARAPPINTTSNMRERDTPSKG
jgi:hypothetical protein